jgi:hypothetical protein
MGVVTFNMEVLTTNLGFNLIFSGCNLSRAVVTFNIAVVTSPWLL